MRCAEEGVRDILYVVGEGGWVRKQRLGVWEEG